MFDSVIPWTVVHQAFLSFTISQSLLRLMFIESVIPSILLIFFCPLLLLPSVPSQKHHDHFRKGRGTRDQIANIHWIIKKALEFQKNMYFCFIDYASAFDYVDHDKLENS